MKQTFEGFNQANEFAQTESKRQNKKMLVFITRASGVQYVAADTEGAKTVIGKQMKEYGKDMSAVPVIPIKQVEPPVVVAPVIEEKEVEPEVPTVVEPLVEEPKIEPPTPPKKDKPTKKAKNNPNE